MSYSNFPNKQYVNNVLPEEEKDLMNEIDFPKIISILRKSIVWVILFFGLGIGGAFTYLRYTPPVYESSSLLRIKQENEAHEVNFVGGKQEQQDLSGEVELVRSKIIYDQVINNLNLWVTYHSEGRFKDEEKFPSSEFSIENYTILNSSLNNNKVFISFETLKSFKVSYYLNGELLEYTNNNVGEIFTNDDIIFELNSEKNQGLIDRSLYFIIHTKNNLYSYIASNLLVYPNRNSQTMKISFQDNNSKKAQAIVNMIDSTYLVNTLNEKKKKNQQSIDYIEKQLRSTNEDLSKYELIGESFSQKNNVSDVNEEFSYQIGKLHNYKNQLDQEKYHIENINSVYELITQDSVVKSIPLMSYIEDSRLINLSQELIELSNKLKILERSRSKESMAYKLKIKKFDEIKEKILAALFDLKQSGEQNVKDIEKLEREAWNNLQKMPSKVTEQTRINRQTKLYENFYMTLQQKKLEYEINKAGIVQDFKVLSPASSPYSPISPVRSMIYVYSLVIAFTLSLLLIIIRYLLHNKLSTQQDFERLTNVPILGIVPKHKNKMEVSQLVVNKNPKASISEAFRSLRTNLEFLSSFDGNKIFSVTSTISGEGKTFISTNLSAIISLSGKKVVLLDLDMRKPKVHLAFGMENNEGVSTILIGKTNYKDCVQHTEVEGLDFISAGPIPPNPSELILRETFDNLLENLQKQYDVIMIDTPPTGLVTDGVLIMKKVDVPLYVCRSEYSMKGFERNLNSLYSQKDFSKLAIIINGMSKLGSYGYGYGYGYGNYYEEEEGKTFFQRYFSKNK